jgi:hypothetical protein
VHPALDKPAGDYFIRVKMGDSEQTLKNMTQRLHDPVWTEEQYRLVRAELQAVEARLSEHVQRQTATSSATNGEGNGLWLQGEPCHADFILYGYYAWSRMNPELVRRVWQHESLPFVAEWLAGFISEGLVRENELYPMS